MKRFFCFVFFSVVATLLMTPTAFAMSPTVEHANVAAIEAQFYTGGAIEPELSVTLYGKDLVEGQDYVVSYADNRFPGAASATITGIGDFDGSKTVPFAIILKDIADASVSVASCTASSSVREYKPKVTVTFEGETLTENEDYSVRYQNNTCAGTAYAIIEGTGSYTGRKVRSFTIPKMTSEKQVYLCYDTRNTSDSAQVNSTISLYALDIATEGIISYVAVKDSSGGYVYSKSVSSAPYTNSAVKIGSFSVTKAGTYTISYKISGYNLVFSGGQYVCRPTSGGTTYTKKLVVSASTSSSTYISSLELYNVWTVEGYDKIYLYPNVYVSSVGANSQLTWQSSNTAMATVDSWGTVTIHTPGTTKITVSAPGGFSDSLFLEIAAIELSSAIKGTDFYRKEHGYGFCAMTDYGVLTLGKDYSISYKEDGAYVDVTLTGQGLFTGQVQYRLLRPMLKSLGSTMQRTGEIILDIAPGMYSGSGTVVTAAYDEKGRFIEQKSLDVSDLSQGMSTCLNMNLDPKGSFKTFFLDEGKNPLGEASGDLSNPPPTKEEQAILDAAAKRVAEVCKTYAVENAYATGGIYKSNFTADGYTGGIWYIVSDKDFTLSTQGPSLVINLTLNSGGYLSSTFSYTEIVGGKYYGGVFEIDPATYSLNDSAQLIRYSYDNPMTADQEAAFMNRVSSYYARMVTMLDTFLRGRGLSAGDAGLTCFK